MELELELQLELEPELERELPSWLAGRSRVQMKRLHNTASQNNIFYLNILCQYGTDRYFPETMNEVTSNWIQLEDGFYDKVSFKIVLLLLL